MARVPIPAGNIVEQRPMTDAKFRAADNGGGALGGLGQGAQQLARAGSQYAETQNHLDRELDASVVRDSQNGLQIAQRDLLESGPSPYLQTKGKVALEQRQAIETALKVQRDKVYAGLNTPEQKRLWEQTGERQYQLAVSQVGSHAARQVTDYDRETAAAQVVESTKSAMSATDPNVRQAYISTIRNVIADQGLKEGLPVESIRVRQADAESGIYAQVIRSAPDYTAAQAALDANKDRIDPKLLPALQDGIDVDRRRQEAFVAHQAALAKTAAQEKLQVLNDRIGAGEEVSDSDLQAGQQLAATIGDESGAYRIGVQRIRSNVNKETKGWTPTQFDGEINKLRSKGEKRTPDQDVRLKQLEAIAPSRTSEFNNNPGAWASLNGHPPPALNLSDPASINARVAWAATVGRATGRPTPLLTPNEARDMAAQITASPAARVAVVDKLAAFGGQAAVAAARQVAPEDALMARMVLLRKGDRAAVSNGMEARKAYPDLVDKAAGKEAQTAFQERLGGATALLGQGDVAAAFEVARNLYADAAVKDGSRTFNAERFNSFVHRALGGTKDAKGEWHGGIGSWNGASVVLPSTMSQSQFETVLTHTTWADANAPVYRNGTVMKPAEIRKLTPVMRPDGRYEFHNPAGQVAVGRNGGIWSLDIESIHRKHPR